MKILPICLFMVFISGWAVANDGTSTETLVFPDGAKSLFIGHSFFIPVAKSFDTLAKENGFEAHSSDFVFASGVRGAPGALWNSQRHKSMVEDVLSSGQVELLGMTGFGKVKSSAEDYQKWIDLALQYNAKTRFLIASPWMSGGPKMDTDRFDSSIDRMGDALFEVVAQLRENNKDVDIIFFNYGKAASTMKYMFEDNALEDVERLAGGPDALFADRFMGHAGRMLTTVSALYWMHELYGTDIYSLPTLEFESGDVLQIVTQLDDYNKKYTE